MRIVIPTTGSRGDVQPYAALAVGLQEAGHRVCLASHEDFGPFIRGLGLDFFPMAGNSQELHESEEGRKMIQGGDHPLTYIRHFARLRVPIMNELMAGCLAACRDADLIVLPTTGFLQALCVAEKLRRPVVAARIVPMTPTRLLASCLFPEAPSWLPGGRLFNYLTHLISGEAFWQFQRLAINRARRQVLDLPPLPFLGPPLAIMRQIPAVHSYSELVLPRPDDWPENQVVTGFWYLGTPEDWRPPAGLVDFLRDGPPPVAVGFGSMHSQDPERTTRLVLEAVDRCGQRAVLLTGWNGLAAVPASDRVFAAPSLPHEWLFPRVAAVVHHGGAGTTGAALRAGVPSVVVPFMADQPFWGRRLFRLGVSPRPIPRRLLSAGRLASALAQAVGDPKMRWQAAVLGARLRSEQGVQRAVEAFHHFAPAPPGEERVWISPRRTPRRARLRSAGESRRSSLEAGRG